MTTLEEAIQVEKELQKVVRGDIKFDKYSRMMYSTDASIYQMEPIGVVLPKDADEVAEIVRVCHDSKTIFLPELKIR